MLSVIYPSHNCIYIRNIEKLPQYNMASSLKTGYMDFNRPPWVISGADNCACDSDLTA
jgi:hypothetical protein